ncbi:50S ribosomal protein L25 [Planctomicrobium piriforme]|uniref:Large ribosomal subunit protein bL25 n=1 Tax=Planctomicrobium piriforme TaxID=1576369 RepID=A0A1I3L7X3_9PLAN|nr:50S ribosomal protein L25 [Planctomicrobium piriforme]SFI80788.1 large subunit ribosomal protein L25 [Planctomicrobium piriforme]
MSHIVKVTGKSRDKLGTATARRIRQQGLVPCNVYGHKQDAASIVMDADMVNSLVRSGARVVDLDVGGKSEKALIKDVQWDTFSSYIMHVDFLRVDVDERVKIDVPLQLKGTAPGVAAGGVLEIPHHHVTIECLAIEVPDFILVRVAHLNVGDAVHVSDLQDLPEGVKVLNAPEMVLVHVIEPKVVLEPVVAPEAAAAAPAAGAAAPAGGKAAAPAGKAAAPAGKAAAPAGKK